MTIDDLITKGTLSINDEISFRTHVDVARLFGKNYKGHQQAVIQLDQDTHVWFPKLFRNADWLNELSRDDTEITMRPTEGSPYRSVMENTSRDYVITFGMRSRNDGYAFLGVFRFNPQRSTGAQWVHERVATTIDFDGTGFFHFDETRLRTEQDDQAAEAGETDPRLIAEYERRLEAGTYAVEDKEVTARTRGSAQRVFAQDVKSNYGWKCAVTGIATRAFLVASHIVPWSEDSMIRLDPSNGICLSTFVDRAFDAGFLEITPERRTKVRWQNVDDDAALRTALEGIDGVQLAKPAAAPPDPTKLTRRIELGY